MCEHDISPLWFFVWIYGKRGERAKAIQWCRNSLASHPGYARSHHYLAQLIEGSARGADEAMLHFEKACLIEPRNAKFALPCARAHAKQRRYSEAERVLRTALSSGRLQAREAERIEATLRLLEPYLNR